jgi:hypothetical protein
MPRKDARLLTGRGIVAGRRLQARRDAAAREVRDQQEQARLEQQLLDERAAAARAVEARRMQAERLQRERLHAKQREFAQQIATAFEMRRHDAVFAVGAVRIFERGFSLEDVFGSYACSLEARACVRYDGMLLVWLSALSYWLALCILSKD